MRAHLLGALLLLVSVAGAAETKYNIYNEDNKVGTLTHNWEGNDDDGYTDTSVIEIEREGQTLKMTQTSKYDKEGVVSEATMKVLAEGAEVTVYATLGDDGAKMKVTTPDGTESAPDIPLATDTTRKDPTWFWFKKVKPEEGATATYQDFDIQSGSWKDTTYTFKGRTKVTIGDKEIEGNEIESVEKGKDEEGNATEETSKIVLDDQGELLVYESDDQKIERILD